MSSPNVYGSRLACRARALRDVVLPNTFHQESKMTQRKTVDDLFVHMLSDIYSAEKQLTKALAKLSRAASDPELSEAFKTHLEETQGQVERIDRVVDSCDIRLKRMKCVAMEGLIEEGQELIDEIEKGAVLDAGLVAAAQKVEHYEIAAYGSLCALGKQLGFDEGVKLLRETLEEEKATDLKLTEFAERAANEKTSQKEGAKQGGTRAKAAQT
jgi:ferritin-like metal-binding protein YciE